MRPGWVHRIWITAMHTIRYISMKQVESVLTYQSGRECEIRIRSGVLEQLAEGQKPDDPSYTEKLDGRCFGAGARPLILC